MLAATRNTFRKRGRVFADPKFICGIHLARHREGLHGLQGGTVLDPAKLDYFHRAQCLQGHLDHRVAGQRQVQAIQLRTAGGANDQGNAQVFFRFAGPQFHLMRSELRVKALREADHGLHKFGVMLADYFDGEIAGVVN